MPFLVIISAAHIRECKPQQLTDDWVQVVGPLTAKGACLITLQDVFMNTITAWAIAALSCATL